MKKYLFTLLSIGTILYACKKDDDKKTDTPPNEKLTLITSATWKYDTAAIADNSGKPVSALPPGVIDACQKDNTITFKSDSTGTVNEGTLKCAGATQTTTFKWWFKDNGATLYSPDPIFGGLNGDVKVIELSATKLRVTKEITIAPYPTTNIMIDLKH